MKEVFTKSFWQGVKKTFYVALEDAPAIFRHKHSGSDFAPAVESVLCLQLLTFPENRAELPVVIMQSISPLFQYEFLTV